MTAARLRPPSRLRDLRLAKGWTQAELARRARVSADVVKRAEVGRATYQATKRKLLKALGLPFARKGEVFPEGEVKDG